MSGSAFRPRKFKWGIGSLFDPVLTLWGGGHIGSSRMELRAAEVSSKCPIYAAPRYPVFALFLETLAAREMLVFMPILNQNSVFEFK